MKKTILLKSMLLLCALIVGSGNLWADYSYTFTSQQFSSNSTVKLGAFNWTAAGNTAFGYDVTKGQQFGTSSYPTETLTLTTTEIPGTINSVTVNASGAKSVVGNILVSVGGTAYGSAKNISATATNYTFEGSKSGTIEIKMTQTSSKGLYIKSITVNYTETKVAKPTFSLDEGLYYGTKSVTISTTTTDAEIYYTLDGTAPTSGSTKYSSAISVSTNEIIRAIGIKGGLENSDEASAEYTIINSIPSRLPKNYNSNYFVKVTDLNDIEDGDAILIVNQDGDYAMAGQGTNIRNVVSITSTDGVINNPKTAQKIVVIKIGNRLFFSTAENSYLYANSSSNNYIATGNEASAGANAMASVEIAANGNATIEFLGTNTRNNLRYNYNSGSPRYSCYASTSELPVVHFYKEMPTATISLNSACTDGAGMYYGTYSNSSAFVVPNDIIVSEIGIVDGKLFVEDYNEGDIVPANTGVMISSDEYGDHTVTITTLAGTSVLGSDNCLYGTGSGVDDAAAMSAIVSDCKYYRLTMHDGTQIGFWWGAENGAAFAYNTANRAFLAVPNAGSAHGLWFEDETTSIKAVEAKKTENGEFYNLSGQRVTKPTKGLYIVNGKKVIIK